MFTQPMLGNPEVSQWALLRASMAFKTYYRTSPTFVWRMAGKQLCYIKAQVVSGRTGASAMACVLPVMYAGLRPDGKFVKQIVAKWEGEGSVYTYDGDGDSGGVVEEWDDDA